jgi:hypothetical protein
MMNLVELHEVAVQAAKQAEAEFMAKHGEPFYCGFAWVEVKVERTNSKQAKDLMSIGFGKSWLPKRLQLWNVTGNPTQSMDIKETGARAYAEVLRNNGIEAYMHSRAD